MSWIHARRSITSRAVQWAMTLVGCSLLLVCPANRSFADELLPSADQGPVSFRVLTFNILQGGGDASNVGFFKELFEGQRYDELAAVIRLSQADVVGVQEDDRAGRLLGELGGEWRRAGSIYSKLPIKLTSETQWLTTATVTVNGQRVVVVNCHWSAADYGPYLVQRRLRMQGAPSFVEKFEQEILESTAKNSGERGYQTTLDAIKQSVEVSDHVILTGDFNEPSHLDWTVRAAAEGRDRWVRNTSGIPLRFPIAWIGSSQLAELGLRDAYRTAYPDEVKHPGNTWTPPYPAETPGRRDFGEQVLDRIDRIYFRGPRFRLKGSGVIGESERTSEIVYPGRWPSDHRAVVAELELVQLESNPESKPKTKSGRSNEAAIDTARP